MLRITRKVECAEFNDGNFDEYSVLKDPKSMIKIGNDIKIYLTKQVGKSVHVLIDAPKNLNIVRGELLNDERPRHNKRLNTQKKHTGHNGC